MSRAACVAALLLMACPPPGGACRRTGVSGDVQRSSFAVVGELRRQFVDSPRTRCPGDGASASVRLFDPDGVELPFEQDPLASPDFQFASTTVLFTPSKPGTYLLEATFPAPLGKTTVEVQAVPNGELGSYGRVVSPVACSAVWPLSDDTIACQQSQASVLITSSDGGSISFGGQELVVAGNVLWSMDREELQRREFVDGGLVITHAARGFSTFGIATLHTSQLALRSQPFARLGRAEVIDGGLVVSSSTLVDSEPFYFDEPDAGLLSWNSRYPCTPEPCLDERAIVALEPGIIWFQIGPSGALEGVDRPWSPLRRRLPRYLLDTAPGDRGVMRSTDRVPLWLDARLEGNRQILVTAQDGGLSFTAWQPASVVNVSGEHVVVREGTSNAVRIYRRE